MSDTTILRSRRRFLATGLGTLGAVLIGAGCRPARRDDPPNVLLITLDTTRADRLGCYGYGRPTSPNLDQLARESLLFTEARATCSWTLPTHASLFTGKFARTHGAQYDPEGPLRISDGIEGSQALRTIRARGLAAGETTLASMLADAGFATGAVVAGPWLKRVFGLDRGFVHYDDSGITTRAGRLADSVTDAAIDWIEEHRDRPFFLFLNYYDPHAPYQAPGAYLLTFHGGADGDIGSPRGKNNRYDAEVLYMDLHLGRLMARLAELGLYDDTMVVVTADHGELLGEHDLFGHGKFLSEPELHIPLLVKYPRGEVGPGSREDPVQLVDVLPLILGRLGLPVPPEVQGAAPPRIGHPVVAEVHPLPHVSPAGSWRALYEDRYKLAWNEHGDHRLFDLQDDPGERTNLVEREPERVAAMRARLDAFLDGLPGPPAADGPERQLDRETLDQLKSLGYVE